MPVSEDLEAMRARVMADYNASRSALGSLTPRRFWLAALSLGITEDMVDARIEALPEPQRSAYRIEKRHAQSYERTHPLVQSLPQAFGITNAALDAAWVNAPA